MVDIPKCKDGNARLPVLIEPNTLEPGMYTIHFGDKDSLGNKRSGFNAIHTVDLPQEYLTIKSFAEERGLSICKENGDLYVEQYASTDLTPSSNEVNLYVLFRDSRMLTGQSTKSGVDTRSIVPGALESDAP